MSSIAVVATLNGIIVHMIMIARVIYGIADQGQLPRSLTRLNRTTGTPLLATLTGIASVLVLALAVPLAGLTARFTLAIFSLVNLALIVIKMREDSPPPGIFRYPAWVPIGGLLSSIALLGLDLLVD